jgi:hypothetical protein
MQASENGSWTAARDPQWRVPFTVAANAIAGSSAAMRSLLTVCVTCATLLALGVTAAQAELVHSTTFGSEGSGDSQFHEPRGIGVDQTTLDPTSGDVYVADTGNARVEQFDSTGHFISAWGWGVADGASSFEVCTSACRAGLPGGGIGQFVRPSSVAVDSSSGTSQGDVYVSDYVNESNGVVDKFSPSGSLIATISGPSEGVKFEYISDLTVDAYGDLWVSSNTTVYEFNPDGQLLAQFKPNYSYIAGLAVDAAGNLYLIVGSSTEKWSASARANSSPVVIDRNYASGLAVDLSTGDLFVDLGASIDQWSEAGNSLGNFGSGSLTEGGQIAYNPEALLPGAGRSGGLYVANEGKDDVAVFAPPALAAPTVQSGGEGATAITAKAATLNAKIDANGLDTRVYFEYGPTTAYGSSSAAPPGVDIGSNFATAMAAGNVSELSPSTTYHYRVVATNALGTTYGPDLTFTSLPPLKAETAFATKVTATSVELHAKINAEGFAAHYHFEYGTSASYGQDLPVPDGSLLAVEGNQEVAVQVESLQPGANYYFRVVASDSAITVASGGQSFTTYPAAEPALLPDNRAYELVSPPDKNGGDVGGHPVEGFFDAAHSAWGIAAAGGSAIVYGSYSSFGDVQSAAGLNQYIARRGPTGWTTEGLLPPATTLLPEELRPGYHLFTPELTGGVLSWGGAPLTPGAPEAEGEFENLYVRQLNAAQYELVTNAAPPEGHDQVRIMGASADLQHVVFSANVALTNGSQAGTNLYEWSAGDLRLASVLPGAGEKAAEYPGPGNGEEGLQENVISADGSRIFWTDRNIWQEGDQYLYVRENGTTTIALNVSQRTPSLGDGIAKFMGANRDGSRVFFIDATPLTNAPGDNGGLYEYNFSTASLSNLSADSSGPPQVEGVLGAGENGLNVYFVARGDLAGDATAGSDNLYLSRAGVTQFIGTLSSEDKADWTPYIEGRTARVTPDGEHIAFVSQASLTGYDNTDLDSGSPDAEVFVYDAAADHLSCASCNPSGARPVGAASEPDAEHTGHIPRFISDDGQRVFFSSYDVLLPSDTNGQQNVYEYEDGVIHMISSGTSDDMSTFSDASTSGDDAFFTTRARLVPEDVDNSEDLYDARVGGGFPTQAAPTSCDGESCRGPLNAPAVTPVISTEAGGTAPEALPAQPPQTAKASKTAPRKSKKKKEKKGRRKGVPKAERVARKPAGKQTARHPRKTASRSRHLGGKR